MPQNSTTAQSETDTRNVRLALAATRPRASGAEVSTDELLALREGTLAAEDRERVLAILDSSPASYEEWLALNRYLDDEQHLGVRRRRPRYLPWAVAAAAAIVAALVVTTTRPPTVGDQLEERYAQALASGAVTPTESSLAFMGEPGVGLGFAAGQLPQSRRALGAGLWAGGAVLSGAADGSYPQGLLPDGVAAAKVAEHPWEGTPWAGHAALGRWLVLVAVACGQTASPAVAFWQGQVDLAQQLHTALGTESALDTPALRRQLDGVSAPLGQLAGGETSARPCGEVLRAAGQMAALGDSRALADAPGR